MYPPSPYPPLPYTTLETRREQSEYTPHSTHSISTHCSPLELLKQGVMLRDFWAQRMQRPRRRRCRTILHLSVENCGTRLQLLCLLLLEEISSGNDLAQQSKKRVKGDCRVTNPSRWLAVNHVSPLMRARWQMKTLCQTPKSAVWLRRGGRRRG